MSSERRILHLDMDAFFASVEQVRDPELRGKPLIIGGEKSDSRGVVSTASYEARAFGVRSAMPLATAKRLCPDGIFMRGNHRLYAEISIVVRGVLERVSPMVQMTSIDEGYVDVSGSQTLFGGDDAIARWIKSEIAALTALPCTIAISPNKLVSKIASDLAKPDGYLRVAAGDEAVFLAPLSVRKMPGFGVRTCERLNRLGIQTLGELATSEPARLRTEFGDHAVSMQRQARGESNSPVAVRGDAKSIGRETTFPVDQIDWRKIERVLFGLAEKALAALRSTGMDARTISLKVRYQGFETRTHSVSLNAPTSIDAEVFSALQTLLPKARSVRRPVRLIGVSLSQLARGARQIDLLVDDHSEKWGRALKSVDTLRERLGFDALRSGNSLSGPERSSPD